VGNVTTAGAVSAGGNITGASISASGTISAVGNITAGNISATSISGTLTTATQSAITTVGTLNSLTVGTTISAAGNITGAYLFGNGSQLTGIDATSIQNGSSNVRVVGAGGNVTTSIGGTSNVQVITSAGVTISGALSVTGDVVAQNVNSLSDSSLKTNVTPITNAGQVVDALNGVGYDWVDGSGHAYGLIAQEVEQVVPEAVKTDAAGVKSVNYSMLVPFLIETVKQLSKEVAELKSSK
jgi:hypothetical protein